MMRQLLAWTLFLVWTVAHAQAKKQDIPERVTKWEDYTAREKQNCNDFNIVQLSTDTAYDQFYRLSNSRQIIEVWRKDSVYGGEVIDFTRTYVDYKDRSWKRSKLIFDKVNLPADTAKIIFYRFKLLDSIPDMDKIKNWEMGCDGETYSIENSSKRSYQLRNFWTPTVQSDSAPYKEDIINFCGFIYKDCNLYRHYEAFVATLPNGSYTYGFAVMLIAGRKKERNKTHCP